MRIALFLSQQDSIPKPVEVSWETLRAKLLKHERTECKPCLGKDCPKKFGAAWSPTDYAESTSRADKNVRFVTAAVFDLEGPKHSALDDEAMLRVAHAVDGLQYICHSTHSRGAYRLVVALSRPVEASAWPGFYLKAIDHLGLPADRTCHNPGRLFFFPTRSAHEADPVAVSAEGKPLDVDAILAGARPAMEPGGGLPLPHPPPVPLSPPVTAANPPGVAASLQVKSASAPVDLEPVRRALKNQRKPGSADMAEKILKGLPLARPGARDAMVNAAASLVATSAPTMIPEEAALELLRPSISAMECAPEGLDHWLAKARYSFQRASARREISDARRDADRDALYAAIGITEGGGNPSEPAIEDVMAGDEAWRKEFLVARDIAGKVVGIKACEANIALILDNDPLWKGVFRFNEVSKEIDVFGGPLTEATKATLDTELLIWLQRSAYKVTLKPAQVGAVMLAVARRNAYDPLADYLNSLKWDGTPRIERWLSEYGGAVEDEHTARIGSRWFISAVARALDPGCKVDTVLILEGSQGKNKSQTLDALFSPFFTDTRINVHDKDSRMLASQVWGVELGELTAFSRADAESLKQFFSQREDKFRPPYGRVLEAFKRRCVFVGTTNKDEYLSDPTGNRRYWPVRVELFDIEKLKQDKDQLWAEAVTRYNNGERWWLTADESVVAEQVAHERSEDVVYLHTILAWWLRREVDRRPDYVTVQSIADEALNLPAGQQSRRTLMDVSAALKALGFTKFRKRTGGALTWAYAPSETLRTASQVRDGRGESLAVVPAQQK